MTLLGAGELTGGLIVGQIRDRLGNKAAALSVIGLTLPAFAMIITVNATNAYNSTSWLMCGIWGIMDSGLNMFLYCIMGF